MTNKNCKFFKLTAIAGAVAAIAAAIAAFITHKNKKNVPTNEETSTISNDINDLDISSIDNDTPRQYVSISINEHINGENEESN